MKLAELMGLLACVQVADPAAEVSFDHEFGINITCRTLEYQTHAFLVSHGLKFNEALHMYFVQGLRGKR